MSKQTTDILYSLGFIAMGVISILTNYKKDPNYKDKYGYRIRLLYIGGFSILCGIYVFCKTIFF